MQTEITIIIMAVNHAEDKNTSNQSHQGQRSLFFFNLKKKYIYLQKAEKCKRYILYVYQGNTKYQGSQLTHYRRIGEASH